MIGSRRIAAACLAAALINGACTDGDGGSVDTTCSFEVAEPRRGDVPVGVDALAPDDVWVVGSHYEGGAGSPYARRWDGSEWRATKVETIDEGNAGFHDVAAVSA